MTSNTYQETARRYSTNEIGQVLDSGVVIAVAEDADIANEIADAMQDTLHYPAMLEALRALRNALPAEDAPEYDRLSRLIETYIDPILDRIDGKE